MTQLYYITSSKPANCKSKFQIQNSQLRKEPTHISRQFLLLFFKVLYFRMISADFCTHKILRSIHICFPCAQQLLRFTSKQMLELYFKQNTANFFKIFSIQLFTNRLINWMQTTWALRNLLNEGKNERCAYQGCCRERRPGGAGDWLRKCECGGMMWCWWKGKTEVLV